jgi:hypothetical protein
VNRIVGVFNIMEKLMKIHQELLFQQKVDESELFKLPVLIVGMEKLTTEALFVILQGFKANGFILFYLNNILIL